MLHYFAGPIFTEWYWLPIFYFMFTWPYALLLLILSVAIVAASTSSTSGKRGKLPDKTIRNILFVCVGLWVLGLGVYCIMQMI